MKVAVDFVQKLVAAMAQSEALFRSLDGDEQSEDEHPDSLIAYLAEWLIDLSG